MCIRDRGFAATANVTPLYICFSITNSPPDASTAARAQTLSTPVICCTNEDDVNSPDVFLSSSAV